VLRFRSNWLHNLRQKLPSPKGKPIMCKRIGFIGLISFAFLAAVFFFEPQSLFAAPSPGTSGYKVIKTVPLGGEGGWDYVYVDSGARRVYISRGTHTVVMDADTYAVVGDIPDTQGVHGIAIATEDRKSTRLNSSHRTISYAVFCLKK